MRDGSPNTELTPFFVGEKIYYVTVVEWYVYQQMSPERVLAILAISESEREEKNEQ